MHVSTLPSFRSAYRVEIELIREQATQLSDNSDSDFTPQSDQEDTTERPRGMLVYYYFVLADECIFFISRQNRIIKRGEQTQLQTRYPDPKEFVASFC